MLPEFFRNSLRSARLPKTAALALSSTLSLMLSVAPAQAQLLQADVDESSLPAVDAKTKREKDEDTLIPCMTWIDPKQKFKGAIVCVHGCGLHKGSYKDFAERMAQLGWAVYAVDVRGFGSFNKQPELGAPRIDFASCFDDVRKALKYVHKQHPDLKVFIAGESMGGAIALRMTATDPDLIDGLIGSVPAGDRFHMVQDSAKVAINLVTKPGKTMDVTPIIIHRSTLKEDLRQRWAEDPMTRMNLTPMELIHFQRLCDANHKFAKMITKTPVLILQGVKDQLIKPESTRSVFCDIPSPDSMMVFVDGAEHLILEEGQFTEPVIKVVTDWLNKHAGVATDEAATKNGPGSDAPSGGNNHSPAL